MFCRHCGKAVEEGARDCPYCGKSFGLPRSAPLAPPVSAPSRPATIKEPVGVATSTVVCAYFLSLLMPFFGFFGGIYLALKGRVGHGVTNMALSILAFFFFWLPIFFAFGVNTALQSGPSPSPFSSAPPVVTLDEFNRLQNGISYKQAAAIIGAEGSVMSTNTIAGFATTMYSWENAGFSNMNAMFQDDKMMSKSQIGLR